MTCSRPLPGNLELRRTEPGAALDLTMENQRPGGLCVFPTDSQQGHECNGTRACGHSRPFKAPSVLPATELRPPSISDEGLQHPLAAPPSRDSLTAPIPPIVNTVEAMGVNDPGLTREIFLWNLLKLWGAPNPGERGTRSVAGHQCLAWPQRTRGPAPLPSAPAVVAGLLP